MEVGPESSGAGLVHRRDIRRRRQARVGHDGVGLDVPVTPSGRAVTAWSNVRSMWPPTTSRMI